MSIPTASRPESGANAPKAQDPKDTTAPPEPALFRLIKAIEEISRLNTGGPPPPGVSADDFSGRDEDNDHVYLWIELPDYQGPDIDINLHGKTLMVRFDKSNSQ
jgi:HSP20 family molecular chaperone IbpA